MRLYARRQRGGGATVAAQAAQYSFVALYNDSAAGHILRVINWLAGNSGSNTLTAYLTQGTVGTLVSVGMPLFTGEQTGAGSIYSGSEAAAPPFGLAIPTLGSVAQAAQAWPWFYLRPGFSVVIKVNIVNVGFVASFWWEDLEMSMLKPAELV